MKSATNAYLATLCLVLVLGVLPLVRGSEPPCACPAEAAQRMVKVWVNGTWVPTATCPAETGKCDVAGGLLSRVPFIGRLMVVRSFSKSGEETSCDEKIEVTGNAA